MKKWLLPTLLLLMLFSGAALADAANPSITSVAVAGKTDLSIAYLSSVFGSVTGVLNGTSGQMFGKLMYQFNQGLLVVAGCWLGFTVLTMVFKSAISGSFMQQDNKVPLILLRVAFGFGLLIPNPSTGYTLLQGIVMQVVVQGVKLADQVWDYGLDYMNSGGSLWSQPANNPGMVDLKNGGASSGGLVSGPDSNAILGSQTNEASLGNFDKLGMIQKVMAMEACMVQSSIDSEKDQGSEPNDFNLSGPQFSINENLIDSQYEFPNADGSNNIGCGVIPWNSIASNSNLQCSPPKDGVASDDNTKCGYSRLAVREMIYTLLPAVKKYVCLHPPGASNLSSSVCSGLESTNDTDYATDAMMGALLNYANLINPLVRQDVGGKDAKQALQFIPQAKKDGWMTAGRYYWDLLRVEGAYNGLMKKPAPLSNYLPTTSKINPPSENISDNAKSAANQLLSETPGENGYIFKVNVKVTAASGASQAGATAEAASPKKSALSWLFAIFLPVVGEISTLIMLFSTKTGSLGLGPEPILWLHNVGMVCISIGSNLWLGTALSVFLLMIPAATCSAVQPAAISIKSVIDWIQPIMLVAAAAFFSLGIFLGYYLPLYPYMLFTFGVIGWIIIVIEAMVAAPLVAMGITHPENHDFLGRSAQAVMLLLGVFLRPALMVIGLFAGMILCQVSLSIILYTFAGFANDIFYMHAPISGAPSGDVLLNGAAVAMGNVMAGGVGSTWVMPLVLALIVFPMFLSIFVMLVYTATTNCFSLIHQLPDYIMTWIGAPASHSMNAKEMAGEIKQGMSSGAEKTAKASGAMAKKANKKLGETKQMDIPVQPQPPQH